MQLREVYTAFAKDKASNNPLNVLNLRNLLLRSILLYFLIGKNC
jgi:hypothetical protein